MAESYLTRKGGGGEALSDFDFNNIYVIGTDNTVYKSFAYDQTPGSQEPVLFHYVPASPTETNKVYFSQNAVVQKTALYVNESVTGGVSLVERYTMRNALTARTVSTPLFKNMPQIFAKFDDGNFYRLAYAANSSIFSTYGDYNKYAAGYWIKSGNPGAKDYVIGNNNIAFSAQYYNINVARNYIGYGFIEAENTSKGNMIIRMANTRGSSMYVSNISEYLNNTYILGADNLKYSPVNYSSQYGWYVENAAATGTLIHTGVTFNSTFFGANFNNNTNGVFQNTEYLGGVIENTTKVFNNMIYLAFENNSIQERHLSNLVVNRVLNHQGRFAAPYIGLTIQNNILYITGRSTSNQYIGNVARYHLSNLSFINQASLPVNYSSFPDDIVVGNNLMYVRGGYGASGVSVPSLMGYWLSNSQHASSMYQWPSYTGAMFQKIKTTYPEQKYVAFGVSNSSQTYHAYLYAGSTDNASTYASSYSYSYDPYPARYGPWSLELINNEYHFYYTNQQNLSSSVAIILHPNLSYIRKYDNLPYNTRNQALYVNMVTDTTNPKYIMLSGYYSSTYYQRLVTPSYEVLKEFTGNHWAEQTITNRIQYIDYNNNYLVLYKSTTLAKASIFTNPQDAFILKKINLINGV